MLCGIALALLLLMVFSRDAPEMLSLLCLLSAASDSAVLVRRFVVQQSLLHRRPKCYQTSIAAVSLINNVVTRTFALLASERWGGLREVRDASRWKWMQERQAV